LVVEISGCQPADSRAYDHQVVAFAGLGDMSGMVKNAPSRTECATSNEAIDCRAYR
jgi:hypothetical protein